MKNLFTRIISGGLYVALIICAILSITISPLLYLLIFGIFTLIAMWEINKLTEEGDVKAPLLSVVDILGGLFVFLSFFLMYAGENSRSAWLFPIVFYIVVRIVMQLYMPMVNPIHSLQRSFFNIMYVAVPLGMMNSICAVANPKMLLALFIFLWLNDSGAYLIGTAIGKHRLFERISPHKSWEGFWGGFLTCILGAWIMWNFFNEFFMGPQSLIKWLGFAIIVSVAGTLGDLAESLIKRTVDVKDASNLIPGHGGLLDRIDSLLLAVPATLAYFIICVYYL